MALDLIVDEGFGSTGLGVILHVSGIRIGYIAAKVPRYGQSIAPLAAFN